MDTICDCCETIMSAGNEQFIIEEIGTVCGVCYDEYCSIAFEDGEPTPEEIQKSKIDKMSYTELLRIWRHSPIEGSELLQGKTGNYFAEVMKEKKAALSHEKQVAASKVIGW